MCQARYARWKKTCKTARLAKAAEIKALAVPGPLAVMSTPSCQSHQCRLQQTSKLQLLARLFCALGELQIESLEAGPADEKPSERCVIGGGRLTLRLTLTLRGCEARVHPFAVGEMHSVSRYSDCGACHNLSKLDASVLLSFQLWR